MSIETLVVALIVFGCLWLLVTYIVPEPYKKVGIWILLGAAVIWVLTHIHALLHLQVG